MVELISCKKNEYGAWVIRLLINEEFYITRTYIEYTKAEAIKLAMADGAKEAGYYFYNEA